MKAVARTFLAVMLAVLVGFALVPGLHALAQEQDAEQGAAVQDVDQGSETDDAQGADQPAAGQGGEQGADQGADQGAEPGDWPDDAQGADQPAADQGAEASADQPAADPIQESEDDAIAETESESVPDVAAEAAAPHVAYRTHVQTYGWQGWVRDGQLSGTTGKSKRLEGIHIQVEGASASGGIEYRTHVQTYGWQGWVRDGQLSGTTGKSKRLEAIQIKLTGELANRYDVWYRVHAQTYGWLDWTCNGQRAGTATLSKRLEAIQICLLPKNSAAPGTTTRPYITRLVKYRTHVQTYGWQGWKFDGAQSGTTGKSKRLEGIHISLPDPPTSGGIEYRTHVQTYGWQGWVRDGRLSGTTGKSKRLEAIQIRLYGQMAADYDVWYRVHAQTFGWMGWTSNGQQAGTEGMSKRLESIQIVLVAKGAAAPSASFGGVTSATALAFASSSSLSAGSSATSPGPSTAGALRVRGSRLVDKNGNPIQLTGVSTHGLAWFPTYVNDACFKQLRTQWNANVVRLAMYTAEYGGYCTGGNKSDLKALVKNGVRYATNNDLYAIVDWHILSDNNPNTYVNEAKEFFADISSTFKNNTNVIYEICNEPNGGTTWSQIKSYANQIIPVIRRNDPDAVIIVGTPTWSQEVDKAAESPIAQDNVMYALHFYASTHKDDLRNRMVRAVRGGLPVFVSEFGICDASGNGAIDESSANAWMSTCKDLGVSWCMWSLCNKAESASVLKSSCAKTSGFGMSDLATSGTWLLKALRGTLPAGTSSATPPSSPSSAAKEMSFTSGQYACRARVSNSWAAGNGKTTYQYELEIKNTGAACSSWFVTMDFGCAIALVNGWNGTYSVGGSKLTIRSMDYNGSIAAGATLTGIGFQVTM